MADVGTGHKTLIGAVVALGGFMIYQHFVPGVADIRTAEPFDPDIENAERKALIYSTVFVSTAAILTGSKEVFIMGGIAVLAEDFAIKHANAVNPDTGKMASPTAPSLDISNAESFPIADYSQAAS